MQKKQMTPINRLKTIIDSNRDKISLRGAVSGDKSTELMAKITDVLKPMKDTFFQMSLENQQECLNHLAVYSKYSSLTSNDIFLVKYGAELSVQPSYNLKLKIARRNPKVTSIRAFVYTEKDDVIIDESLNDPLLKCIIYTKEDRGEIRGAWCKVVFNGETVFRHADAQELEAIVNLAKGKSKAHQNFSKEMRRKAIIARTLKELDIFPEDVQIAMNESDDKLYDLEGDQKEQTNKNSFEDNFENVQEEKINPNDNIEEEAQEAFSNDVDNNDIDI